VRELRHGFAKMLDRAILPIMKLIMNDMDHKDTPKLVSEATR